MTTNMSSLDHSKSNESESAKGSDSVLNMSGSSLEHVSADSVFLNGSLRQSDYVHVSQDSSLQNLSNLTNSNTASEHSATPADQNGDVTNQTSLKSTKSEVTQSIPTSSDQENVLKNKFGNTFIAANLQDSIGYDFVNRNMSSVQSISPESFEILGEDRSSPESPPDSNNALTPSRFPIHFPESVPVLPVSPSDEKQRIPSSASSESIVVLKNEDADDILSLNSESTSSQTYLMEVVGSGSIDRQQRTNDSVSRTEDKNNKQNLEAEHVNDPASLSLESINPGFESLLETTSGLNVSKMSENTKEDQKPSSIQNDEEDAQRVEESLQQLPSVPSSSLPSDSTTPPKKKVPIQMYAPVGRSLSLNNEDGFAESETAEVPMEQSGSGIRREDHPESFALPRNSLEWWPEPEMRAVSESKDCRTTSTMDPAFSDFSVIGGTSQKEDNIPFVTVSGVAPVEENFQNSEPVMRQDEHSVASEQDKWSFLSRLKSKSGIKDQDIEQKIQGVLYRFISEHGTISSEHVIDISKLVTDALFTANQPDGKQECELNNKDIEQILIQSTQAVLSTSSTPSTSLASHEHIPIEVVVLGQVEEKVKLPISRNASRLLSMLGGKTILKDKYNVAIEMDFEGQNISLMGSAENIQSAIKAVQNNDWLKDFLVKSWKLDPLLISLLSEESTRDFLDTEKLKDLAFRFCWSPFPNGECVILHAENESNITTVMNVIQQSIILETFPLKTTGFLASYQWRQARDCFLQKHSGKVLIQEDYDNGKISFACTEDVGVAVRALIQGFISSSDKKEEEYESMGENMTSKFLEIEKDKYLYLRKWKMVAIDEVSSNQGVSVSEGQGNLLGFLVKGPKDEVPVVCEYIVGIVNNALTKKHDIESVEAITFLRDNDFKIPKYLERHLQCYISIEHPGTLPEECVGASPPGATADGYPVYSLGDLLHVYVVCDETKRSGADMLVEPADKLENTPYGSNRFLYIENQKKKGVKVIVPTWKSNTGKEKHDFIDKLVEMFEDLQRHQVSSVAFSVTNFKEWPYGKLTKAIIWSLQTYMKKTTNPCLQRVYLCDTQKDVCQQVCNILQDASGDGVTQIEGAHYTASKPKKGIEVMVVNGQIALEDTDIIVNTTSRSLDLKTGTVSKSILEKAGKEIQEQLKKYQPNGITPGDVAISRGFSLNCKHVYHGALESWPQTHATEREKTKCIQILDKFVTECLNQAHLRNHRSIAFPALGCGVLGIPPIMVARNMFQLFKDFEEMHPNSSLELIKIVIYPAEVKIYEEFSSRLDKYNKIMNKGKYEKKEASVFIRRTNHMSMVPALSAEDNPVFTTTVNGIKLTAAAGDITKQKDYDSLVMLYTVDDVLQGGPATENDPVLSCISTGPRLRNEMSVREKYVTPAGDLPQKKIIHVQVKNLDISKGFLSALKTAEEESDLNSVVLPLRGTDILCKDIKLFVSSVFGAFTSYAQMRGETAKIKEVKICIAGQNLLSPVLAELRNFNKTEDDETHIKSIQQTIPRPMVLRITTDEDKMREVISELNNIESSPESFHDIALEEETEIANITQDVYEAFLFFHNSLLQSQENTVNMNYNKRDSKIVMSGPRDVLYQKAKLFREKLQELTSRLSIDMIELPGNKIPKEAIQTLISDLQPQFTDTLLYIPESESVNSFHIVALSEQRVQEVKKSILSQINLVSSHSGRKFLEEIEQEYVHVEARRKSPVEVDKRTDVHTFFTAENIQVYVYQEDILNLPVAAIVNAANEYLQHGGGIARVISDAAGKNFDDECQDYIRRHGLVKVGTAVHTSAGELPYAYVIHTVGPRWDKDNSAQCTRELHSAVESCILKAASLGVESVGIPAISSGIFGVPVEICAEQYALGVISASRRITQPGLKEIHFIDTDPMIVALMKRTFASIFMDVQPKTNPTFSIAVNPTSATIKLEMPISDIEGIDMKVNIDFPKADTYTSGRVTINEFSLSKDFKILVYTDDIIKCRTDALMCGEDERLQHRGEIAQALVNFGGKDFKTQLKEAVADRRFPLNIGDVLVIEPGRNFDTFVYAFIAISPAFSSNTMSEEACLEGITACNLKVLKKASELGIRSIAMPMLGTGKNLEYTSIVSSCLAKQLIDFFKEGNSRGNLKEIHVVNKHEGPTLALKDCLDSFVNEERQNLSDTWRKALSPDVNNYREIPMEVDENVTDAASMGTTNHPFSSEQCVICMDKVSHDHKVLDKCQHVFCTECIDTQFQHKPVCPTCGVVYGVITGNQPPGEMSVAESDIHLPRYTQYNTLTVTYDFESGIQQDDHPNPGQPYEGTARTAYFPNNPKGQLAVKLLRIAFDRRLVFTIGHSRTTGMDNVITWNDIHHKTTPYGGPQRFGYPDPDYLDRLLEELAVKGVTEKDLQ